MNRLKLSKLLLISLLCTAVAACGPAPSSAPPAAEATAAPTPDAEAPADEGADAEPTEAAAEEDAAAEGSDTAAASGDAAEDGLPTGLVTYMIVPEESSASYIAEEEFFGLALGKYGIPAGLSDTVGTTSNIEGQFQLNWDDLGTPLGENTFTVDLSTLKSNQGLRDDWIRENGPEFNTYPTATFVAESLEGAPDTYTMGEEVNFQMIGQLTIREVTNQVTFDVTAKLDGDTVTGTAISALKLTDFGITPPDFVNTLTVADDFQVKVDFTAREQ
jgi:polyisoprenoid-binding protein YceI